MMKTSKLIVVSAPSGCGKTTIVRAILDRHPEFRFSVSATTRPRRQAEVDGRDYFFLTRGEFQRRVDAGEFAEWEEVFGNRYGTLKSQIDRALAAGTPLVFDVDVKGGLSIKRLYPADTVTIFIEPPSFEVLRSRLALRGTETPEQLDLRLARAQMELREGSGFEHHVVNDLLEKAVNDVEKIILDATS